MFLRVLKSITFTLILIVLLSHHSLQANAMHRVHQTTSNGVCESDACQHGMSMDICEKIQNDEMQTSSEFFVFPEISNFIAVEIKEKFAPFSTFENAHERIPIDYQQLARSHLS